MKRKIHIVVIIVALLLAGCEGKPILPTDTLTPTFTTTPTLFPTPTLSPTPTPSLEEFASRICQGEGVDQAAIYAKDSRKPHRILIMDTQGKKHYWNESLIESMQANKIEELEAIVCVKGTYSSDSNKWCGSYFDAKNNVQINNLILGRKVTTVNLVEARTGKRIESKSVYGEFPPECPASVFTGDPNYSDGLLVGSGAGLNQMVFEFLPYLYPETPKLIGDTGKGIENLAISPDGTLAAFMGNAEPVDRTVTVWDVENAAHKYDLNASYPIHAFAFSPDSTILASVGNKTVLSKSWEIKIWDLTNGTLIREIISPSREIIQRVAFSPDGSILATSATAFIDDNSNNIANVILWDVRTGKKIDTLVGPSDDHNFYDIYHMGFSPDGKYLAGESGDSIVIWDTMNGQRVVVIKKPLGFYGIENLIFLPNEPILVAQNNDGEIIMWDMKGMQLEEFIAPPGKMFFSSESQKIVTFDIDTGVGIWDFIDRQPLDVHMSGDNIKFWNCVLSTNGKFLLTGTESGKLFLWDLGWISNSKSQATIAEFSTPDFTQTSQP